MPIAAAREGEASGSRAPAPRRGRSSSTAAAAPTSLALTRTRRPSSSGSQSAQEPLVRSKRRAAGSQRSSKRKRASHEEAGEREEAAGNQRSNKRKRTRQEEEEVEEEEERKAAEEEEVSSAGSSPLRNLKIPDELYRTDDLAIWDTIKKAEDDVKAKLARRTAWATLNTRMYRGFKSVLNDPKLVPDRESTRKAVIYAAQSVVGLTSSVGGKPLARCCGFWVHWNKENKIGTVLTTSGLIRTKSSSMNAWLGQEKYDPDAEVIVHLRGSTTEKARLHYLQKHYDLAFFSVKLDQPVQILSYNDGVKYADQVLELGRDESSFLRISHGVVRYSEPNVFERYHYMHVDGADSNAKYGKGGPLIDFEGKIVGMVNGRTRGSFIPSSILIKCLHLWSKFECIPRPHLGMKFWSIKLVDLALAENIFYMCNIDDGLIVKEVTLKSEPAHEGEGLCSLRLICTVTGKLNVYTTRLEGLNTSSRTLIIFQSVSEGSPAEKLGIRDGDVIKCVNGEHVTTTVELENMLLGKCEDESGSLKSEVNVKLWVFHVRKSLWRNRTLKVNVSDDGEIVHKGVRCPFGEGASTSSVSPSGPSETPRSIRDRADRGRSTPNRPVTAVALGT